MSPIPLVEWIAVGRSAFELQVFVDALYAFVLPMRIPSALRPPTTYTIDCPEALVRLAMAKSATTVPGISDRLTQVLEAAMAMSGAAAGAPGPVSGSSGSEHAASASSARRRFL